MTTRRPTTAVVTIALALGAILASLASHPAGASMTSPAARSSSNRRFFVDYRRQTDGATVIAQYQASLGDPNVADPTETVLLVIAQPFANHNGGMVEFGPDGFLSIGMGVTCRASVSPVVKVFSRDGGSGSVVVTAAVGCDWTAVSNVAWVTVTAGGSGTGAGTVSYSVDANSGGARRGTLTIAGRTVTVRSL